MSKEAPKAASASGAPHKEANTPPLGRSPPAKKTPRLMSPPQSSQRDPLGKALSIEPPAAGKTALVAKVASPSAASDGKVVSAASKAAMVVVAKSAVAASALATKVAIVQAAVVSERSPATRPAASPISFAPSAQEPERARATRAARVSSDVPNSSFSSIASRDTKAVDEMVSTDELDAFMAQGGANARSPRQAESEHGSPTGGAPDTGEAPDTKKSRWPQPSTVLVAAAVKSPAASSKETVGFELWQQLLAGVLLEVNDAGVDRHVIELFESIDDDHGGTLSRREVAQALRSSGIQADEAALASMMKVAGVDFGSKGVTIKHFTQMSRQIVRAQSNWSTIQGSFQKWSDTMSKGQAGAPGGSGDAALSRELTAEAAERAAAEKAAAEKKRLEVSRAKAAAAAKHRSKRSRSSDEPPGEEESHEWTAAQWLQSLSLHEILLHVMREKLPPPGGSKQFNFVRRLTRDQLEDMFFSGASANPKPYRSALPPLAPLTSARCGWFASRLCSTRDACQRNHRCPPRRRRDSTRG